MTDVKYHVNAVRQRLNPKLKRLWIETTDLCNSRCKTCSIWKNRTSKRNLDYNVLGNPLFKRVDYVLNSGGEPSLCDLKTILLTEHKLLPKATLQVSTNGLLPDKVLDAVEAALSAGAKVDVGISLDGIGQEHDLFRGVSGNFEKVDYLITKLGDLKRQYACLNVTVGSTLTSETVKRMGDLTAYAKTHDIAFMWHWLNKSTFYNNLNADFECENKKAFSEAICKVVPDSLYREAWLKSLDGFSPTFDCYALRGFAVLRCNGDVAPCLTLWDKSIGNIMKDDPMHVWNSPNAKAVRCDVRTCGKHGCLNSWGYAWSLQDSYFPVLTWVLKKKIRKTFRSDKKPR